MKKYKAGEAQRSGPHRKLEKILDSTGISYLSEEPFPPYTVDILLPDFWVVIEIDGPFHSKAKDKIRDEYLWQECNLPVLRISIKEWKHNTEVLESILDFLDEHAETAALRKREWLTRH